MTQLPISCTDAVRPEVEHIASAVTRDRRLPASSLRRIAGIAAGILTHVLFGWTVWSLYWFLKEPGSASVSTRGSLLMDILLALQFAVPHSVLLYPRTRRRLGRRIAAPFYGLFFCAVTCVSLLAAIRFWQSSGPVLWDFRGTAVAFVTGAFLMSWVALIYSLHLSGAGYQTGLTPWLEWVRQRAPGRRAFQEEGLYRWFRHPIYLSFLGLIWFTPTMTADRFVLAITWSVYILVGSWLKDRRLEHYLGDSYREYESRVPGYPLVRFGPLGLRSPETADQCEVPKPKRQAA